jgi:radical SAM protein with 4Fe4S-binding SPASM domain
MQDHIHKERCDVINWNVTGLCNLRCRHCFAAAGKKASRELSTEEGLLLLEEIRRTFGKIKVTIGNAEPLMRKDILKFVNYGSKLGLFMAIATNGKLFSEEMARRLKRAGLKEVDFPVDGIRKTHDKIRGKGTFDKVLKAAKFARKEKINIVINSCISKINKNELTQIFDISTKIGAKRCEIFHYISMGRGLKKLPQAELNEKQYVRSLLQIYEEQKQRKNLEIYLTTACQYWIILNEKFKNGDFVPEYFFKMVPGCGAGISILTVKPDGNVAPCPMLDVFVGNVRKTSLKKLWNSKVFEKLRLREVKGQCAICKHKNICMGCRVRAFICYKDFLAEDPLCGFFEPYKR